MLRTMVLSWAIHFCTIAESAEFYHHWRMDSERFLHDELKPVVGSSGLEIERDAWVRNDPAPECVVFPNEGGRLVSSKPVEELMRRANTFSIGVWARISSGEGTVNLMGTGPAKEPSGSGFHLTLSEGRVSFQIEYADAGVDRVETDSNIPVEKWVHLATVAGENELVLFLDGEPIGKAARVGSSIVYSPGARLVLGRRPGQSQSGPTFAIADVKISSESWDSVAVGRSRAERKREIEYSDDHYGIASVQYGPFIEWAGDGSLSFEWETGFLGRDTQLTFWPKGEPWDKVSIESTKRHGSIEGARLEDLRSNTIYEFYLSATMSDGEIVRSRRYSFDTALEYSLPKIATSGLISRTRKDSSGYDHELLKRLEPDRGYCLVPGIADERLTRELVMNSEMQIVGVQNDITKRNSIRNKLSDLGIYGARASVISLQDGETSLGPYFANLVILDHRENNRIDDYFNDADLYRMLRPYGGKIVFIESHNTSDAEGGVDRLRNRFPELQWESFSDRGIATYIGTRGTLAGAGEWTHQYGNASNTSCSEDELVKGEMSTLWWGEPGPRPMPDRGPRNPAPLQANGRMYIQGNRTLFGVDAYNGSILWFQTHPELRRANLPRDCSNMVADASGVYVAEGRYCISIDGATGKRSKRFDANSHVVDGKNDWGFLSVQDELLIGTSVRPESSYLGDDGEWYENYDDSQTSRVISLDLFAVDLGSGDNIFVYKNGMILNSTITIDDGVVYFIESRNPALESLAIGRASISELTDQHLVALDINSGEILMEEAFDFGGCDYMTYVAHSGNTLVVTGADKDKKYHTYAFDTNGIQLGASDEVAVGGRFVAKRLWSESHKEDKGHHSGHLQHPVIIGDVFYSDQRSFDLRTGETLRTDLPERRGCGTMSAAKNSLFFRHYFHGMWDLESDDRVQFEGIRTGCWLGIIPSGGIVLAPESSAGCSCTHSIQTSMALAPAGLFE